MSRPRSATSSLLPSCTGSPSRVGSFSQVTLPEYTRLPTCSLVSQTASIRIAGLLLQPGEAEASPSEDGVLRDHGADARLAWPAFRRGDREGGLNVIERAATHYESVPFDFGPPVPVKPPQ